MITAVAFLVALGILVTIHEYGHFRVARACGVKVLRFSVGFGKPLLRWTSARSGTEYVVALLPLGGYVRMLDEREAPVPEAERSRAFNVQPVWKRFLIVLAGPVANLLLAVLLYAAIGWNGVQELQPVIAQPAPGSVADKAGLVSGDTIVAARRAADDEAEPVQTLGQLQWLLLQAASDAEDLVLQVRMAGQSGERTVLLPLQQAGLIDEGAGLQERLGIGAPWMPALVGEVVPGEGADQAGLRAGDKVLAVNGQTMRDATQLRRLVRESTSGQAQQWLVERAGRTVQLRVIPQAHMQGGQQVARIGAMLGVRPATVTIKRNAWESLAYGVQQTWDMASFSLRMLGRMVVGEASLRNLSGPVSIADYAGQSARAGLTSYLAFLALVSVSLGVLNLLPVPILDGGHLMYYLWEFATGRPVPEAVAQRLQRVGMVMLLGLMGVALFNDLSRLFGSA